MFFRRDGYTPIPSDDLSDATVVYVNQIREHKRAVITKAIACYHAAIFEEYSHERLSEIEQQISAFNANRQSKIQLNIQHHADLSTEIAELVGVQSQTKYVESQAREQFEAARMESCRQAFCLSNTSCCLSVELCLLSFFTPSQLAYCACSSSLFCLALGCWMNQEIKSRIGLEVDSIYPPAPYFNQDEFERALIPQANATFLNQIADENSTLMKGV